MTTPAPELNVGMVGLNVRGNGWAAEAHAPAVQAVDGLVLARVATTRAETAAEAAARFGVPRSYGDPLAMIADPDIDVVAVVSPVPTHRELILAALEQGKPVLTEWPVAVGRDAMAEITAAAARVGVPHAVNLQARRSPAAVRLAELVAEGALGRILSVTVLSTTAGFGPSIVPAYVALEDPATWTHLGTIQTAHTLDLVAHLFGALHDAQTLLDVQHTVVEVEGQEPVTRTLPDHVLVHGLLAGGGTLNLEVQGGRPRTTRPSGWRSSASALPPPCSAAGRAGSRPARCVCSWTGRPWRSRRARSTTLPRPSSTSRTRTPPCVRTSWPGHGRRPPSTTPPGWPPPSCPSASGWSAEPVRRGRRPRRAGAAGT